MLKRIFWAATITIPLYLSLAIDSSLTAGNISQQIVRQQQQVLGYLKERFAKFKQGSEVVPTPSVRADFGDR